jgi:hypothetical protein
MADQDTGEQTPAVVIPTVPVADGESSDDDSADEDEPCEETATTDGQGDKPQDTGTPVGAQPLAAQPGDDLPSAVQPGVVQPGDELPATQAPGGDSPEAVGSSDEGTDAAKAADDVPATAPSGGSTPAAVPASGAKPTGPPTIGAGPSGASSVPDLGTPPDSGAHTSPAFSPAAADVDSAGSTRSPEILAGAIDDLPDLGDRLGSGTQTPFAGAVPGTIDAPGTDAGESLDLDIGDLIALVESGEIDGLLISSSDGKVILEVNPSATDDATPGLIPPSPGAGDRVNELIEGLDTNAFSVTEQGSGAGAIDFPGQLVVISVAATAGYLVARLGKR